MKYAMTISYGATKNDVTIGGVSLDRNAYSYGAWNAVCREAGRSLAAAGVIKAAKPVEIIQRRHRRPSRRPAAIAA
jgi:hypothetical protein